MLTIINNVKSGDVSLENGLFLVLFITFIGIPEVLAFDFEELVGGSYPTLPMPADTVYTHVFYADVLIMFLLILVVFLFLLEGD